MGYNSYITDCDFKINTSNYEEMVKNGILLEDLENNFWVEFDIRVIGTIKEECKCCNNSAIKNIYEVTSINNIEQCRNYNFAELMKILEPYVEKPCWVEFMGEDGDRWRYCISKNSSIVMECKPEIVWPEI